MASIKNVAVIGASGNAGKPVVAALIEAGFSVTALTREDSSSTFPAGVAVKKVDYSSAASLQAALQGQDAVVSTVGAGGLAGQKLIVDAAVAAGVKRFIPSEFGINTTQVAGTTIGKLLAGKVATREYLAEKAAEKTDFSWTGISTGLFYDWVLASGGTGIDFDAKTATVVDSGNEEFYASNLAYIGKAVAAVLAHPAESANKYISIASFPSISQNQVVSLVEELTGQRFARKSVPAATFEKVGDEKLAKGDFSAFVDFLKAWNYADGAGHALKDEDNAATTVLGLPKESLKDTLAAWLKQAGKL